MPFTSLHNDADANRRIPLLILAIALVIAVLLGRLFYLQVAKGDYYRQFSENNRITNRWIPALRGTVLDRNRNIMVANRPSFDLLATRAYVKDIPSTITFLDAYLNLQIEDRDYLIKKLQLHSKFKPMVIKQDLTRDQLALVESHKLDNRFNGIETEVSYSRNYPYGEHAAHLLGYVGEISKQKLEDMADNETLRKRYRLGSTIGLFGMEKLYEGYLQGEDGSLPIEVDARGKEIKDLGLSPLLQLMDLKRDPKHGFHLHTTIDLTVQKIASETFKPEEAGGLVAMDPSNGEILAMVSKPGFDPMVFAKPLAKKTWAYLNNAETRPLNDRAVAGTYSPGSTYKLVVALAALAEGIINEHFSVSCSGGIQMGRRYFSCWKEEGHGVVDLRAAITRSCDVWFYRVGEMLGPSKLALWARKFGFGTPTGLAINHEKGGLIPTPEWKEKVYKVPWQNGETIVNAIGQGFTLVTPMQLAMMAALIANHGKKITPRLATHATSSDEQLRIDIAQTPPEDLHFNQKQLTIIREAMRDVVNLPGGTAYWFSRSTGTMIAGKTGTVQVVSKKIQEANPKVKKYKDHALFVAFAPFDDPKIAVGVVVEHGEHGSSAAAPKAKAVIEAYLTKLGIIVPPADPSADSSSPLPPAAMEEEEGSGGMIEIPGDESDDLDEMPY